MMWSLTEQSSQRRAARRASLKLIWTRAWALNLAALLCACGARPLEGRWHKTARGDTLSELAERYDVPIEDLIELNQLADPSKIQVGQRLFIPRARSLNRAPVGFISLRRAQRRPSAQGLAPEALTDEELKDHPPLALIKRLRWPLRGAELTITSPFGPRGGRVHKGIDLRAPRGAPSLSALAGKVVRVAYEKKGYGRYIIIDHGQGLESRYAHHHKNLVSEGDSVEAGAQIGEVGNTGRSSGPHLHFELRYRGEPLDPLVYLPAL